MRDITEKQFDAALIRNGFARVRFCLPYFEDTTGATPNVHYGAVVRPSGLLHYRATLAHLLQARTRLARKSA